MDKNEAFEVILQVTTQFRGTIQECNIVQEAVALVAKELEYKPKTESQETEMEDLEKPKKK